MGLQRRSLLTCLALHGGRRCDAGRLGQCPCLPKAWARRSPPCTGAAYPHSSGWPVQAVLGCYHTSTYQVVGQSSISWVATTPTQFLGLVPRTGEGALLGTRVAPGLSRACQCYVGTLWMHCHNRIVHMALVCVSVILPAALPDRLAHYAGVCLRSCLLQQHFCSNAAGTPSAQFQSFKAFA